jgi:hypothetical protein
LVAEEPAVAEERLATIVAVETADEFQWWKEWKERKGVCV